MREKLYDGRGVLKLKNGGANFRAELVVPYLERVGLTAARAFSDLYVRNLHGEYRPGTIKMLDTLAPFIESGHIDFFERMPRPLDFERGEAVTEGDRFRFWFNPEAGIFLDAETNYPDRKAVIRGNLVFQPNRYEELPAGVLYNLKHLFFVETTTQNGWISRMDLGSDGQMEDYRETAVLRTLDSVSRYLRTGMVSFTGANGKEWSFVFADPIDGKKPQWFYREEM